jgi:alginate O-acetyltransferase complex protein AlgI
VASLVFYTWGEPSSFWVLPLSVVVNYAAAFFVSPTSASNASRRKWMLGVTVVLNLALLAGYKYVAFLISNWNEIASAASWKTFAVPPTHLPLGISFFTFQAISYVVDVYRGTTQVQRRFVDYALYACLFPHLLAGPIVRYADLARELSSRSHTAGVFASGVRRFIIGLAKKVLVANPIAVFVDDQFAAPTHDLSVGVAWMAVIGYGLQIYCDFSAYSDMAIGLGRMFGFHFMENFNQPYHARSMRDFWRRWHISLSSWFRDYVYIPLGGSRHGPVRELFALVSVFLLCGLWHGANWTFVLWGLWHGVLLLSERLGLENLLRRLWRPLQHVYLLVAVSLGWVLFRCQSVTQAVAHLKAMCGLGPVEHPPVDLILFMAPQHLVALAAGVLVAISPVTMLQRWAQQRQPSPSSPLSQFAWQSGELAGLAALFLLSVVHLAATSYNPFIYFRF